MRHPIDPWVFIVVPLVVVGLGFLIASSRRGSVASTLIGSRRMELHSAADPATVFERIRGLGGKYRTDDADPQRHVVVLSSSPTFATWGFLYPVYIHAEGGGSRIEIGIASRFIQFGPLVTSAHKQCTKAIEDAISIPVARIA
ncbi:MAG: hypothetical protein H0T89_01595 [Deltaproteobacteria bacterium]|nr:hypothetical protein [Deltaproteobacteria bacterium]